MDALSVQRAPRDQNLNEGHVRNRERAASKGIVNTPNDGTLALQALIARTLRYDGTIPEPST
jgi:hypothetical protein